MRHLGVALAVAWAATTIVVAVPASPAGATPCAFASASSTSVAVVVDFGDGSPVSAVCVPADSADNGAEVLAARARVLGTPAPRFDSSGFLCGIDGYPSSGCGEQSGSTYAYWSYWHGDGTVWNYANGGAGGSRVHSNIVEGWRFQSAGAGNPSDPPPNASPDPASTCAPPTTSPATSTQDSVEESPSTVTPPTSTTLTVVAVAPASSQTTPSSGSTSSAPSSTVASSSQAAAAPVRVSTPEDHASPWPAVAAGGAIAGLGATGVIVARRRRGPP